ncbi:MAG: CDP-archaeol synthase [Planctomycetaceae bacterium]|nr:CDP-archaeol synthase [Planctomycetaceae bacterium]
MADLGALRARLKLGPLLIAALAGLFWADARSGDAAPCLAVLAILLTLRSVWEYVDLLRTRPTATGAPAPNRALLMLCALVVVSANWVFVLGIDWLPHGNPLGRLGPPMLAYSLSVMALFVGALVRYRAPGGNLETLGLEILGLSYLAVLISATLQLRWVATPALCYLPLASVVVITKCGDTAAYFAGHAMGGKKLSPLISPGKTWAGVVGALFGAALGGWLCLSVAPTWFADVAGADSTWSVTYGIILGILGIVGDLAESLIKRDVGRKDSAPLLPGFGGLLDLLDSVIFVGPAAYLLWLCLPLPK